MALTFPDIDPVALAIGPLAIRWYALAYLAGILGGWFYARKVAARVPDRRPDREDADDFITWAIIGVVLGGRLGFVLFYQPDYFLANPQDILKLWQGGMSFHGGASGVILALILYGLKRHIHLLRLSDMICAAVPIGLFFGRLANFINGELFGRITDAPWGMVFPAGGPLPRHPSQLYEAGLEGLVLFAVLAGLCFGTKVLRDRPGIVTGVFLCGYAAARMFVELFRQPDAYLGFLWGGLTMGQILSLPMIAVGLGCIVWAYTHPKEDDVRKSG